MGLYAGRGQRFTLRDLTLITSASEAETRQYLQDLFDAGIVTRMAGNAVTPASYHLSIRKWTGPKTPQVQRLRCIYDPNNGDITHLKVLAVERGGK